jgi:cholest-4-en-3-one 26-monooxygenase
MTLLSTEANGLSIPDLTDQQTFADEVPHAAFAAIQQLPGLYWQPTLLATTNGGFWAVTRFADIQAVEKDIETFTSTRGAAYPLMTSAAIETTGQHNLMHTDPPRHTRLRRAAAKGFSPRVVANFEPWVRAIVRDVLSDVADKTEFDCVTEFAQTIPARVISRVLGVPPKDRQRVIDWANVMFAATQQGTLAEGATAFEKMEVVGRGIGRYIIEIQEIKRRHPDDDMLTAMSECAAQGEISQAEFVQWMTLMLLAGFETTHTAIGQSMRMYLEDSDVRAATNRAVAEGKSDRVADEYLRLICPPMQMARTATRDLEFAGQQIREGDVMVLYYVAANRDPAVYSEPHRFNPWRAERTTLAFGSGVHRCIGSHLAKLEVQIFWEECCAAGLQLRLNGTPKRGWSNFINQLTALPVAQVARRG